MTRTILVCVILVLAILAVYWQTTGFGYIEFDDPIYVRDNRMVHAGLTAESVNWALTTGYHSNWHPLSWWSWMLDASLWGVHRPGYFHATNFVLHTINALLLLGVLRAMTGAFWRSAFVAGAFALHPIHVESVAWISERKDVLCGLFWMLTMWAYLWHTRRPGVERYALMMVCFALGLMAKGMIVTLPLVLLLLDYWPLKRGFWILDFGFWIDKPEPPRNSNNPKSTIQNPKSILGLLIEKVPLLVLSAACSVITYLAQRGAGDLEEGVWIPIPQRFTNAALSYVRYLGKAFWPQDLAILYPSPNLIGATWPAWMLMGSFALLAAITVAAIALSRTRPYFIVGWLWFAGTMAPVSGVVQMGRQSMADRYAYLPFIGLYIIVAWGVADLLKALRWRSAVVGPAMAAVMLAMLIASHRQTSLWRDSFTLFQHALDATENNWFMHNNLGGVLSDQSLIDDREGRFRLAAERRAQALEHFEMAIEIFPQCAWLHDHFGRVLVVHDRLYEAQQHFEEALRMDPDMAKAHEGMAIALSRRGQTEAGLRHIDEAVRLDPDNAARYQAVAAELRSRVRPGDPAMPGR